MSTPCQNASPNLQKLDPLKRVNYTFGLVLGVEEFVQSDTYFLAKHHAENRLLHGYGTVCGLDVVEQTTPVLEVQVTPGWAITPRGQEIKVPQLMCVQLDQWLAANLASLQTVFAQTAPPATLNLCVVLCYRECKTDTVPIPGQPCQTQSSPTAPSRIADSFELMLCLDYASSPPFASPPLSSPPSGSPATAADGLCMASPLQLENDAESALAALLAEFEIAPPGPGNLTLAQVEQLVLSLVQPLPSPPPLLPPGPPYLVGAADMTSLRGAALRTWITQVRPFICEPQGAGPCCPPPEKCVLLAELTVALTGGATEWLAGTVTVDDSRRPFLVPTMLLQKLMLADTVSPAFGYQTVAAGSFTMAGAPFNPANPSLNGLTATPNPGNEFLLYFPAYKNGTNYIVKGTAQGPQVPVPNTPSVTFELVDFEAGGIRVRVQSSTGTTPVPLGFMAEISQIGGFS